MKSRTFKIYGIVLLLIILTVSLSYFSFAPSKQVEATAIDFKTIKDGIEYAEATKRINDQPIKMNLLRLDLSKVRLDVVHAKDKAIGTETVSDMAKNHKAFAAINAGFFRLDDSVFVGDSAGVLQIDGKLLSESYKNRIALFITNNSKQTLVNINHLNLMGTIQFKKKTFNFIGLNRQRSEDDLVIFTPEFSDTTLTSKDGLEIVVEKNKITKIFNGKGNSVIPQNGFVISVIGKNQEEIYANASIGQKINFQFSHVNFGEGLTDNPENLAPSHISTEDIVGGVPLILLNGKIKITWEQEKTSKSFVETKHPRTAVAKLKDGKFLMITVDGRSEESGGIDLQNLAEILLELGATDAMNLDGGGSTTMFLDGKVVNKPSDKEGERKVSDAILVFPRKK